LFGHTLFSFGANLVSPGQVTVTPNIPAIGWMEGGVFRNGVNTSYSFFDGWSLAPINRNLGGFVQGNFVSYNVFPVDVDMVPYADSNAKGTAKPLTGQLAYYPPRFNAVDPVMSPFKLRTELTTMGAYDSGSSNAPSSPPHSTTDSIPPQNPTSDPTPPPTTTTPGSGSATLPRNEWLVVGREGDTVPGKAGMTFRYGSPGGPGACGTVGQVAEGWVTKTLVADENVTATNNAFGTDPAYCIVKVLQMQTSVAQ
jgi:hypothetical protein